MTRVGAVALSVVLFRSIVSAFAPVVQYKLLCWWYALCVSSGELCSWYLMPHGALLAQLQRLSHGHDQAP